MEVGAEAARSRAVSVLRVRGRAVGVALAPAAVAVVLLVGGATGRLDGAGWDLARWIVTGCALVVLAAAAAVALVIARARPAVSPTVPVTERSAPDLYRLVRDLADRLDVPPPSAIALTPDCDSWLEDRTPPVRGRASRGDGGPPEGDLPGGRATVGPVLVIGSPFMWWMRVAELRAVLAPVVAGTGPSAHPDIVAARRFLRGLDAAVAVAAGTDRGPAYRASLSGVGLVARMMLRKCGGPAADMERCVAAAAAERAQAVDYGLRIVAQEQVGLAYAGWDRLLTRVALPAWRMGRWPARLDAGVVSALTELSRRDRLADGFTSRLGERPACDLLEEPGAMDESVSLLAARLFHGGPAEQNPAWSPVSWQDYPDEVVDRKWRMDAARLHRVLDGMGVGPSADPSETSAQGPTLARVIDHLTAADRLTAVDHLAAGDHLTAVDRLTAGDHLAGPGAEGHRAELTDLADDGGRGTAENPAPETDNTPRSGAGSNAGPATGPPTPGHPHYSPGTSGTPEEPRVPDAPPLPGATPLPEEPPALDAAEPLGAPEIRGGQEPPSVSAAEPGAPSVPVLPLPGPAEPPAEEMGDDDLMGLDDESDDPVEDDERTGALAAGLTAELAREEAAAPAGRPAPLAGQATPDSLWDERMLPLFPHQPPRTARELLTEHVTALVCCAAVDTAGADPGLDWLDGPSLVIDGERTTDLGPRVLSLVVDGDALPLRRWLARFGIRPEKPVRLV
ncbi:hypothetical protein GBW32_16860 [Streptomyces tsukubensis]|uniref:Uncharacterized protein n=1 Tax=Streptomyces tsukubensis TaxID=83656 RepID=A0A1V4A5I7_9ACTN|nr:hypothetical protein B1H18_22340 [Streptomyces tsukubensis]QFR97809.1 hypothetical protein GBW32_16860 [Streptomyces tsukubensis]